MNLKKYCFTILLVLFQSIQLFAQQDTIVVNTYDYTIKDNTGETKELHNIKEPGMVLNGQYKVMKTNSWHEDMFVKNNLLHGKNYIYYINVCSEERNYYNGLLDGKQYIFHSIYVDGKRQKGPIYGEKTYSKGIQIDTAFSYYEDLGFRSITPYNAKGYPDGRCSIFYPGLKLEQVGEYDNGKPTGTWSYYYDNGKLSKEKKYDKKGSLISEQTYYRTGQKNIEKNLKGDIYVGRYERFDEDGQRLFCSNYKNGYQRGKQILSTRPDNINEFFINSKGQLHGDFIQRDSEGGYLKVQGKFKGGVRDSKWCYYAPDGKLFREEFYKNGQRMSVSNNAYVYDDGKGTRVAYNENFNYIIPEENPNPKEIQKVEEEPFFLFGE